jgi:hypothetical protein
MRIFAIDPGNERSAWVVYETALGMHSRPILSYGYDTNERTMRELLAQPWDRLAIEMVACMGMSVGAEVFETVYWIGRYVEAFGAERVTRVYRREEKMHLCGNMRAKDTNIRQALIDRFGPGKDRAIGNKKNPGPLYGISGDVWQALAVAIVYVDTKMEATANSA